MIEIVKDSRTKTTIRPPQKVDYVICMPGQPSSGSQSLAVMALFMELSAHGKTVGFRHASGSYVYGVRNECLKGYRIKDGQRIHGYWTAQKPFENEYLDYDRIIWIDSDNFVYYPMVEKLISYDEDIVAAWYRAAFRPQLSDDNNVSCGRCYGPNWDKQIPFKIYEMPSIERNEKGLIEVDFTGFGLCVMKKGVFESITYPWFQHWPVYWTNDEGEQCCEVMSEDVGLFAYRAKEKGFKTFVDPEMRLDHEKRVRV